MGRSTYAERRRGRGGCAGALLAIVFVAALCALVYAFALRPAVSRAVGEQISGGPAPTMMPQQPNPPADIGAAVEEQADAALPGAVAALPPGELVVTEEEVNGYIATQPEMIAPLDSASLRFVPGQAVIAISAYGMHSIATVSLAAQGGRLVVTDVAIDNPLGLMISGDDLARPLAERLNAELATQGRSVEELRIEEGQLVLVTS
jgi:glucose/arabinose dehydrogenase